MDKADRALIWRDCPQCAYKHLTAAFAIATSKPAESLIAENVEVFLARARVLCDEALAGYPGNFDLARGCVAAAETFCETGDSREHWRRHRLDCTGPGELADALPYTQASAVAAHITEALRELPELARGGRKLQDRLRSDCFYCIDVPELLDDVAEAVAWVVRTYELAAPAAGAPQPAPDPLAWEKVADVDLDKTCSWIRITPREVRCSCGWCMQTVPPDDIPFPPPALRGACPGCARLSVPYCATEETVGQLRAYAQAELGAGGHGDEERKAAAPYREKLWREAPIHAHV